MKMKKTVLLACVCGIASLGGQSAFASGLKVRGGVTNNAYQLDETTSAKVTSTYAKSSFSGTSVGLTWLIDDTTYIDYANSSGSGTWTPKTGGDAPTFTRSDNAIVLGGNSISSTGTVTNFYFGWKNGEAKLSESRNYWGSKFNTSGFVFGGGWGIPAGNGAVLLSLGMGLMDGSYAVYKNTGTTTDEADMTFGFSYGIGYTYPITPNVGITVDYKANSYKYTFNSGLSSEWSLDEKLSTTSASLSVRF